MKLFHTCIMIILFLGNVLAQNQDTIAYNLDIEDVVITSQYAPTHYKNSLHNVDIIKREEITKRGYTQLDQALALLPSVRIAHDPILGSSIKVRGVESNNVAILKDGVPIIGRLDGALDLSQISLDNIERIEVIEGPQSVLYGNNASGGVINLISKKSQAEDFNISSSNVYETTGLQKYGLTLGLKAGNWLLSAEGRYLNDQQYPDDSLRVFEEIIFEDESTLRRKKFPWNPKEQMGAKAMVRYLIDEENSVLASVEYLDEEVLNLGEVRRPTFMPYAFDESYLTTRKDYSLTYTGKIKATHLNATIAYNDYQRLLDQRRFEFDANSINEEQSSIDSTEFDAYFGRLSASFPVGQKLNFLSGVQINTEKGKGARIIDPSRQDSSVAVATEMSLFTDLRYSWNENLTTSLSARWTEHSSYGSNLSPSTQTRWKFADDWILRFGYARGFRSPALKELFINFIDVNHNVVGSADLQPEVANDWSMSLSYNKRNDEQTLNGELKLYRNDIKNKIILSEFEPQKFRYQNLNDYSVQGLLLSAGYSKGIFELNGGIGLGFWYNSISEQTDSPSYNKTIDGSSGLLIHIPKTPIDFSFVHRFVGELPSYYLENEELKQSVTEAYQIMDASFFIPVWKDQLKITAGIKNIMNVVYSEINNQDPGANHALDTNSSNLLVARGRTFFIGLNMNFKGDI